jgi:hypothetical protein
MNRLSFLKLVFLPPVDSVLPKYTPFEQPSSSGESSHLQLFVDSMALAHFFYIIRVICT